VLPRNCRSIAAQLPLDCRAFAVDLPLVYRQFPERDETLEALAEIPPAQRSRMLDFDRAVMRIDPHQNLDVDAALGVCEHDCPSDPVIRIEIDAACFHWNRENKDHATRSTICLRSLSTASPMAESSSLSRSTTRIACKTVV